MLRERDYDDNMGGLLLWGLFDEWIELFEMGLEANHWSVIYLPT